MYTRILILVMLVATACTPSAIRESATPQEQLEATGEAVPEATVTPVGEERPPVEVTEEEEPASDPTATPVFVIERSLQKKFTSLVMQDLAAQLNINAETISVISFQPIVWPDAALGCPFPDKVYAQGTVPGFRILLKAENKEYSYHTDQTGEFILCPEENIDLPDRPALPVQPGEIDDGEPWVPVN